MKMKNEPPMQIPKRADEAIVRRVAMRSGTVALSPRKPCKTIKAIKMIPKSMKTEVSTSQVNLGPFIGRFVCQEDEMGHDSTHGQ